MSAPLLTPISRETVTDLLESTARMLELKGENLFKVRAYLNAARAVETYPGSLEEAATQGTLTSIPGIGKAIAEKIGELLLTGRLPYYEELKATFPPTLFDLFEIPGLGAKKIRVLYEQLAIDGLPALEAACAEGKVATLPGFGTKTAQRLLEGIAQYQTYAKSFLWENVAPMAGMIRDDLHGHPDVAQIAIGGSYRRHKEIVNDLDFVAASKTPEAVIAFFTSHPLVDSILMSGPTKASVRLKNGPQADLRVVTNEEFPFALNYFTGSKEHNIRLRNRALARGWTLNEYRLGTLENTPDAAAPPPIMQESDLYRALGLDYVTPELREDLGEVEAAESHTLPRLIEIGNLRGTFHNHTTASDGRSTLEEMAQAAQELGLQYLGIADHSKSSVQAHGLDEARLQAQCEAIARLNTTYDGFRLFSGTECDILPDGSLDFCDEVLSQLDYVVASIHSAFSQSQAEMTARIIKAISNPHVTMLGHLTGRLLLSRKGYAVDVPAIIEAAAQTGTIIELNATAQRLDMDWRWWPLAKEKGVLCSINPDAHHVNGLQRLALGVSMARKGWLTRDDVVNTLPLGKIEAVLAAKRTRTPATVGTA